MYDDMLLCTLTSMHTLYYHAEFPSWKYLNMLLRTLTGMHTLYYHAEFPSWKYLKAHVPHAII
jgi:hypothetical protein